MFVDCALYLFIILIILKFFGVLMCPWWAVFTPILLPLIPIALMLILYVVMVLIAIMMGPFIKIGRK